MAVLQLMTWETPCPDGVMGGLWARGYLCCWQQDSAREEGGTTASVAAATCADVIGAGHAISTGGVDLAIPVSDGSAAIWCGVLEEALKGW